MNIENINKVIEALKADRDHPIQHFKMRDFADIIDFGKREGEGYQVCNTAMCVAGWANTIAMLERNDPDLKTAAYFGSAGDKYAAAEWLGIDLTQADHIFFMEKDDNTENGSGQTALNMFDAANRDARYAAAIEMLETLRDTGRASWQQALLNNGLGEIADEIDGQPEKDDDYSDDED